MVQRQIELDRCRHMNAGTGLKFMFARRYDDASRSCAKRSRSIRRFSYALYNPECPSNKSVSSWRHGQYGKGKAIQRQITYVGA